jgi:hypothetical protein
VPRLGEPDRRIVAAWSAATSTTRPTVVAVMGIDELLSVKQRSPGARRQDSPWNDPAIGFAAMCEKTAKRRLARSLPLNVMVKAAVLDEAHEEQGRAAWIRDTGDVVVEGEVLAEREPSPTPSAADLIGEGTLHTPSPPSPAAPAAPHTVGAAPDSSAPSVELYIERWHGLIDAASTKAEAAQLAKAWNDERELRKQIWPHELDARFMALQAKVTAAIKMLREEGR